MRIPIEQPGFSGANCFWEGIFFRETKPVGKENVLNHHIRFQRINFVGLVGRKKSSPKIRFFTFLFGGGTKYVTWQNKRLEQKKAPEERMVGRRSFHLGIVSWQGVMLGTQGGHCLKDLCQVILKP